MGNAMGTGGKFRPVENTGNSVTSKGWGMYPLLQVRNFNAMMQHRLIFLTP